MTAKPNKKNIIKLQTFLTQTYGVHKPEPTVKHNQVSKPKP